MSGRTVSVSMARSIGVALVVLGAAVPVVVMGVRARTGGAEEEKVQWRPALVKVPAGVFMMGSPEGEFGRQEDERLHEVTLTHDFYMCQTEVTQAQWEAVMGENPSNCAYGCGDDVAVHDVSLVMAVGYLNALSEREGLEVCYSTDWKWERSCDGYRLPTEAEWEYAARAGTESAYSFGEDAGLLGRYGWWGENADDHAHVVAQKEPNDWDLYDVHGNVWEWVWGWYEVDYGSDAVSDPVGPQSGSARVLRGGSFGYDAGYQRPASRNDVNPFDDSRYYGLRCARGPHPSRADVP